MTVSILSLCSVSYLCCVSYLVSMCVSRYRANIDTDKDIDIHRHETQT